MPRQSIPARAAACLFALLLLSPAVGHAGRAEVAAARDVGLPDLGIRNFGRVNAGYYRGAEPTDGQYAALAALGIRTIVDLRSHDARARDKLVVERAGMRYVQIPMTTQEPPSPSTVERFLQIVDDPANQPVYVHCVGGRHRTGVMTAVYRMIHDLWTPDQAFKEMKQYKFGADFLHPELKRFVYAYRPGPPPAPAAGQ